MIRSASPPDLDQWQLRTLVVQLVQGLRTRDQGCGRTRRGVLIRSGHLGPIRSPVLHLASDPIRAEMQNRLKNATLGI